MAVTSYDGSFSFKQDSLARLGDRAKRPGMGITDMDKFQNSPFMQTMRKIEELTFHKMSLRDKKRAATDPTFKPSDEDFEAAKAHKYDQAMNYYKTLGVDEYAPQKEVKDAYKRLSLVYHPDKTAGLPSEVKEEYGLIFIELKNAYQTLADNPTRRQYDRDRDKAQAAAELNGWKVKERAQFDATEVLKRLQEEAVQKKPSKVVELSARCRLEKFFYGGHKAIKRKRRVKSKKFGDRDEERLYRIDVPAGHAEPFVADFRRQGDQHEDQHADTLRFSVTSKPHERVERKGNDLVVKQQVSLGPSVHAEPYLVAQVPSIRGRQLLLWGVNPFFRTAETSTPELRVRVQGEGLGERGALSFSAKAGGAAEASEPAAASGGGGQAKGAKEPEGDGRVVITVKHLTTEAELFLLVSPFALVGDIRKQAIAVLGLGRGALLKLLKPLSAGKFTPWPDSTALGDTRFFRCGGTEWHEAAMNPPDARGFLKKFVGLCETPQFREMLALARETQDKTARAELMKKIWAPHAALLPEIGRKPEDHVLWDAIPKALKTCFGDVAALPEAEDVWQRIQAIQVECEEAQRGPTTAATSRPAAAAVPPRWEPGLAAAKRFVLQHGLGPPGGFKEREVPPAMRRRQQRRAERPLLCEVLLAPMGGPVTLFTKPTCSLSFYTNYEASSEASSSSAGPGTLFAVCLASQACSRGKAAVDWDRLKYQLMPLLRDTCFRLLRASRALLPRPLAAHEAAPEERPCARPAPAEPWKRLGDEAFRRGDYWLALSLYARRLEDLPQGDAPEEAARVLSNLAGCFAKVKEYGMSLQNARAAAQLQPRWAKAWSRVGLAAAMCGSEEDLEEARDAYHRAVELEPSDHHVRDLHDVVKRTAGSSAEAAHAAKERGNEAMRGKEWSAAVASYTVGLAQLPLEAFADTQDQFTFLRSVLLCNRAGAFSRLRNWPAAVADAEEAVQAKKDFAKAHCRLGVALLGSRRCEQAYVHFAKALTLLEDYPAARRGRNECLGEMLRWRSVAATARMGKRLADAQRPKGSTRVFAISDVHFDHKVNEEWAHSIDDSLFQEDVLIVAGDLAGTKGAIVRGLTTLRAKFRRVFYTVGHHEMWVHHGEHERYPDSIAKLQGIFEVCDELRVDVCADAVCEDVFVVPLHSWYHAEFDERDPWPDPNEKLDSHCRWPMDADDQVWKYMLKLNEAYLGLPYHGTVITFSHFLPRRGLPLPHWNDSNTVKTSGCERIDDQVRAVRSKLHVFGHSHQKYFEMHRGVIYVQQPLGFGSEQAAAHDEKLPMLLVYDGRTTCARPWDIGSDRPQ